VISFKSIKVLIIVLLLTGQSAYGANRTFKGKLIDADTLEPIEGAVVIAIRTKTRAFFIDSDTRFKDLKETLTDKKGEWAITGPEGSAHTVFPGCFQYIGIFIRRVPYFLFYKPGYKKRGNLGSFVAIPYVDEKRSLEGIILIRPGDTWEEVRKFDKKYDFRRPFIPASNPERKLRNLDFSFQYPEKVGKVYIESWDEKLSRWWEFTVIGLKKAKTREERLKNTPYRPTDYIEKMPFTYKMINEERKRFGLKPVGRKAK